MKPDPEDDGAIAHYLDPAYYDQMYRRRMNDRRYYAATACGSMLELGAGTGRVSLDVALALAEQGEGTLLGLERVDAMRLRAEEKRTKRPRRVRERVAFVAGDFRSFDLDTRFDQIIAPFNTLMHLYDAEEIERCLGCVAAHLTPGGIFRFDVLLPDARNLARNPNKVYHAGAVRWPGTEKRYRCRERYDYDPRTQTQHVEFAYLNVDDPLDITVVPLTHRQFFPEELRLWLRHAGFEVLSHEGGFDGEPLTAASESQVITCRRNPSRLGGR
ncbi:MAG: class I SAM-dependent methyltransferase [Myxococcota bacterium]